MSNHSMRSIPSLTIAAVFAVALYGCGKDGSDSTASSASSASSSPVSTPESSSAPASSPDSAPSSAPSSAASTAPSSSPASTLSSASAVPPTKAKAPKADAPKSKTTADKSAGSGLPQSIVHDGYAFSGVSFVKPLDMELTISDQKAVRTGSQQIKLKEVKDGKAVYSVDRTGQLAILGTEEWTVTDKGVYTTKSSMMDLGPDAMELPAHPTPGMSWKVHTKSSQPTASMDMQMTFKVVGFEPVSTKAGKFKNALVIEQDGTGTLEGQKVRTESKNWYVKGIGLVKATMTNHLASGKTELMTIQETNAK